MKKFWFGMVGNWDYMATFGCFAEAETEEAAAEIIFVMDVDGYSGRENYADWLNKREVK